MASCLSVGLKLLVTGCSLKKARPAKYGSQNKLPTTLPNALQLPAPSGDRATKVPWSRAAREKLPSRGLQSSCCPLTPDPPALPQAPDCSAGNQELPWLLHLVGQSEEAQPPTSSCPIDRVPGPPTQGAPRSHSRLPSYSARDQDLPWLLHLVVRQPKEAQPQEAQPRTASPPITSCPLDRGPLSLPQGVTRSPLCQSRGSSAGSQELPWLLHLVGQPENAQPQEAHTQEAQPKATLSPVDSCPLDRLPPLQEAHRRPWRPLRSSARSQGLPQPSQRCGQPQAARAHTVLPPISAHPLVRRPVPQPWRGPSRPWRPPGCAPAPAGLAARPARLPAL